MSGPLGLHGGGEYVAGDEPFLDALITSAAAQTTKGSGRALRIVVVPTAAARGMPDRAAAHGVAAFERRARVLGVPADVAVARVVDAASAALPDLADLVERADLVHLPGGDPDLLPVVLADTPVLAALRRAWARGAVVAGASAGAMALAEWAWTPRGGLRGLAFVHGLAVVPHYDDIRRTTWQEVVDRLAPGGLGYLGLDEQTGVLADADGSGMRRWVVAGPGAAWWFPRGAREPVVARSGEVIELPV